MHHPEADTLLDYAAGRTSEAVSLVIATHLALCPACRTDVRDYESLGGALIEASEPVAVSDAALAAVLARLDDSDPPTPAPIDEIDEETARTIPQPLRGYLKGSLDALAWRKRGRHIREASIALDNTGARAMLLRIAPGAAVPFHTHSGVETTLILKGAYTDSTGRYARGDLSTATSELTHAPMADSTEECICFSVVEGELKLTGALGRLLNLFIRV